MVELNKKSKPSKPASTNFQDKSSNAKWYAPKSQCECS